MPSEQEQKIIDVFSKLGGTIGFAISTTVSAAVIGATCGAGAPAAPVIEAISAPICTQLGSEMGKTIANIFIYTGDKLFKILEEGSRTLSEKLKEGCSNIGKSIGSICDKEIGSEYGSKIGEEFANKLGTFFSSFNNDCQKKLAKELNIVINEINSSIGQEANLTSKELFSKLKDIAKQYTSSDDTITNQFAKLAITHIEESIVNLSNDPAKQQAIKDVFNQTFKAFKQSDTPNIHTSHLKN